MTEALAEKLQEGSEGKQYRHSWDEIARNTKLWVSWLWQAMARSGRGYKRPSLRHTGRADDRRKDKVEGVLAGIPKFFRSYAGRYASPPIRLTEKSRRRRNNLMKGT